MAIIERVPTGIAGFDKLIEGGFVKNSNVLVSGGTGTGKTIFCSQYLVNGASQFDEPGVFVSFEQTTEDIRRDLNVFGWDIEALESSGKLKLIHESPQDIDKVIKVLEKEIMSLGAKRLVIDSTSVFGLAMANEHEFRTKLFDLVRLLKKLDVTTLLTAEILEESKGLSRFGVEEFIVDGVVVFYYLGIGQESNRTVSIRKMRTTKHSENIHPIDIGKNGISIKKQKTSYNI